MSLGSQHAPQKLPKSLPKSTQKSKKNDSKIGQMFACILNGSLAQHGPKIVPKAPPRGWHLSSLVGPWRGLGGLLEPLAAQE